MFNKDLLNAYYVLDTALGTEYLKKEQTGPCLNGVYILEVWLISLWIIKEKISNNPIQKGIRMQVRMKWIQMKICSRYYQWWEKENLNDKILFLTC